MVLRENDRNRRARGRAETRRRDVNFSHCRVTEQLIAVFVPLLPSFLLSDFRSPRLLMNYSCDELDTLYR